jgi:hypothetical protein
MRTDRQIKGRTDGQTDKGTDGQTERQTGMTKVIVAFRNFVNVPKIATCCDVRTTSMHMALLSCLTLFRLLYI